MAKSREIPSNHYWLRPFAAKHGVKLEVGMSDEEVASLCATIPTKEWMAIKNAWRQHQHATSSTNMIALNRMYGDAKMLGGLWQRLIKMDIVSEATALTLAERGAGSLPAYSDAGARYVIAGMLEMQAENLRARDPRIQRNSTVSAAAKFAKDNAITDPESLAERLGCPVDIAIDALSAVVT